jgi:signal transduction histidine kinase
MLLRVASLGAMAYSVVAPALLLASIATQPQLSGHTPAAVIATVFYVPLYVDTVRRGLQGAPRRAPWGLAAMAVVIVGATPFVGSGWLAAFGSLGASLLIVLRPRWSIPAFVAVVVAAVVWSVHLGDPTGANFQAVTIWYAASVTTRSLVMFVLVWLVAALRQLRIARVVVAEEAIAVERRRLDEELRHTVGTDLAVIVERGTRAADLVATDSQSGAAELMTLVDGSRRSLAATRRMIARYKVASSRAQLDTAVALLRAAGVEVEIEVPDDVAQVFDEPTRSSLRELTTQLLRDRPSGPVLIRIVPDGGSARVECDAVNGFARVPAGLLA